MKLPYLFNQADIWPKTQDKSNQVKSEMALYQESLCWIKLANNLLYANNLYDFSLDSASEPKFTHLIDFLG